MKKWVLLLTVTLFLLLTLASIIGCQQQPVSIPTPVAPIPTVVPSPPPTTEPAPTSTPIPTPAPPTLTPTLTPEPTPPSTTPAPVFVRQGPPNHETPHFAIWTDPDALNTDELAQVAELLEKSFSHATAFLNIDYDVATKGKIPVLFRSSPGIIGFTTSRMTIVFSDYRRILRVVPGMYMVAEITHIITGRHPDYLLRHLDALYSEFKFTGARTFPGCGFTFHQQAAALVESGRFVPIADVPADLFQWGFVPGNIETIGDLQQAHRFYAEAASFGQYLIERYGIEALKRLTSRPDRDWEYAYGQSIDVLQKEWLEVLDEVRKQNPLLVARLAEAAKTSDPCKASRLIALK